MMTVGQTFQALNDLSALLRVLGSGNLPEMLASLEKGIAEYEAIRQDVQSIQADIVNGRKANESTAQALADGVAKLAADKDQVAEAASAAAQLMQDAKALMAEARAGLEKLSAAKDAMEADFAKRIKAAKDHEYDVVKREAGIGKLEADAKALMAKAQALIDYHKAAPNG